MCVSSDVDIKLLPDRITMLAGESVATQRGLAEKDYRGYEQEEQFTQSRSRLADKNGEPSTEAELPAATERPDSSTEFDLLCGV